LYTLYILCNNIVEVVNGMYEQLQRPWPQFSERTVPVTRNIWGIYTILYFKQCEAYVSRSRNSLARRFRKNKQRTERHFYTRSITVMVNQSRYRPAVAQRVPGS